MRPRVGDDRLAFLQCAMNHMIRHMLHDYQALGIVTFSGRCQVAHPLVVLNTTDARDGIAKVIDGLVVGSGTSIGCGLSKATEMLEGNGTSARGGLVFLVTDGDENYKPWIVEQLPILVSSGVKVSTFALGTLAEKKLEDVALQTGGTAYAFGNLKAHPIAGLTVSFLLSTTAAMPKEEQYVVLLDETEAVSGRKEFPFTIPKELGHETKILVTTPNDEDYDLKVEDSNGKVCTACNVTLGKQSTNIDMPRTSTTNTWRLVVTPKAASIADITVVVLSKQRVPGQDPIRAESSVEHNNQQTRIYTKVTKGTAAVLGALVTATVTFGEPGGTGETLQLLDNGIGADNLKDDGDYSAFFTQLKGAGRYSVRTDVRVTKNTRLGPYKGAKPQPAEPSTPSGRSGPPGPPGGSGTSGSSGYLVTSAFGPSTSSGPPGPSGGPGTSGSSGYLVTSASGPSTPSGPPGPFGGPGTSGSSGSLITSASGTSPPYQFVTKLFNPGDAMACGPSAECKKRKGHHVASNSGPAPHARQTKKRVDAEKVTVEEDSSREPDKVTTDVGTTGDNSLDHRGQKRSKPSIYEAPQIILQADDTKRSSKNNNSCVPVHAGVANKNELNVSRAWSTSQRAEDDHDEQFRQANDDYTENLGVGYKEEPWVTPGGQTFRQAVDDDCENVNDGEGPNLSPRRQAFRRADDGHDENVNADDEKEPNILLGWQTFWKVDDDHSKNVGVDKKSDILLGRRTSQRAGEDVGESGSSDEDAVLR
ncbi:uncharacterized protein LOC115308212 [Ixodes scapularis]|uniref:uncharacterized protein LOC115308212 n=1 Tax=Ixodes scapularis TaxID=6945 RepID=UPI001AD64750|nr:uncharacterized protein LOC115308212 [Ixodes scapularis]